MRHPSIRLGWSISSLALLAGLAAACSQQPGSFALTFTWDAPPAAPVWIWARVEERVGDAAVAGPILASAGPARFVYGGQVDLAMGSVPNGDDRVVVVEVREGESAGLPVLWYGLSEPFALRAGDDTAVEVALKLKRPEAEALEATVALQWGGAAKTVVRPAELATAGVVTRSTGAEAVVLANDASFSAGLRTVTLETGVGVACTDEAEGEVTWRSCVIDSWDLGAGLPTAGDDGLYSLFAKFVDRYGYESGVKKATVQADGTGPQVLTAALTTTLAKAGDAVVLTVTAHEAPGGDEAGAVLAVTPSGGVDFAGPTRVGTTNTVQWVATIGGGVDPNAYTFSVTLADALGNQGASTALVDEAGEALVLRIDVEAPTLASTGIVLEKDGVPAEAGATVVYGLPAEGFEDSGTLSFGMVLREENAPAGLPAEGPCDAATCPLVLLGGKVLGALERAPDQDGPGEWGFRYSYEVLPGDWGDVEQEPDLSVRWTDAAGNRGELEFGTPTNLLRLDFVRPAAMACEISPTGQPGKAGDMLVYAVTADEPLREAPGLAYEGTGEAVFSADPDVTGQRYVWSTIIGPTVDTIGPFGVFATLFDRAGNASDGAVCAKQADIDGYYPVLKTFDVETVPAVTTASGEAALLAGPGSVIRVTALLREQTSFQEASLRLAVDGENEFTTVSLQETDPVEHLWTWVSELRMDGAGAALPDGAWGLSYSVIDTHGNFVMTAGSADVSQTVTLDRSAPTASCFLDAPQAAPGRTVHLTVVPSEPVRPQDVDVMTTGGGLVLVLDVSASSLEALPQRLVYAAYIDEQASTVDWTYRVRMRDYVGNESAGGVCDGGGIVDGEAPEMVTGVGTAPSPRVFGLEDAAHREQSRLAFSFALREPHAPTLPATGECPESAGCPSVRVGDRMPGVLTRAPEWDDAATGRWGFAYQAELTSASWGEVELEPTITLFWQDVLGNALSTDFGAVTLDFVAPELELSVDPVGRPARLGETVTITVQNTKGDALDAASLALESEPPLQGVTGPAGSGALYRWTHVTTAADDGAHGFVATGRDLAGNAGTQATATAVLDGKAPGLELVDDLAETRLAGATAVFDFALAFATDDAALTVDEVAVVLQNDAGWSQAMEPAGEPSAGLFAYGLRVDTTSIPVAEQSPFFHAVLTAVDAAGNQAQQLTATIQLDVVAPRLASVDLTGTRLAAGAALQLVLTADKRLAGPPTLAARQDGDDAGAFDVIFVPQAPVVAGQLRYVYDAAWPDPLPAEGQSHAYEVRPCALADTVGNVNPAAVAEAPVRFVLDRVAPKVAAGFAVSGTEDVPFKADGRLDVTFAVEEDDALASGYPKARLGSYDLAPSATVPSTGHAFELAPTGSEVQATHDVVVELLDRAGNRTFTTLARRALDFTAPELAVTVTPSSTAGANREVRILVTHAADLDTNGVMLLAAPAWPALGEPLREATQTLWTYVVPPDEVATYQLTFGALDGAGNDATARTATVALDGRYPGVALTSDLAATRDALATAAFDFALAFTLDDPTLTAADVSVLLRNDAGFAVAMTKQAGAWSYTRRVDYAGLTEGQLSPFFTAEVEATDAAGNRATKVSRTVQLDVTPPGIASLDVTPYDVVPGGVVRAVLTADERLGGIPALTAESAGQGAIAFLPDAGQPLGQLRYTYTALWPMPLPAKGAVAVYEVQPTTLVDQAGNAHEDAAAPTPQRFRVDGVAPTVSTLALEGGRAGRFSALVAWRDLTVAFDVSDAAEATPPAVQAGLETVLGTRLLACEATLTPGAYECPYVFQGDEGQGGHLLTVSARDVAGNTATAVVTATSDFAAPEPVTATCGPILAKLDDALTCRVTLSEPVEAAAALHLAGTRTHDGAALDLGVSTQVSPDARTLTWKHTAAAGQSGAYTVALEAPCDDLGNCAPEALELDAPFELDVDAPRLRLSTVTGDRFDGDPELDDVFSEQPCCDSLLLFFEASDPYGEWTLSGTVGRGERQQPLTCSVTMAPYWRCEAKVEAPWGDPGGLRDVTLRAADAAGNETVATLPVTFDFAAPAVVSSVASPDPARLNGRLRYVAAFSEPLGDLAGGQGLPTLDGEKWEVPQLPFGQAVLRSADHQTLTWETVIEAGDDGTYTARVSEVCDPFENCATRLTEGLAPFTVDATPPPGPSVAVSRVGCSGDACDRFSAEPGFEQMTITVTFQGDATPGHDVTVDGQPPSGGCESGVSWSEVVCHHTVTGGPGDSRAVAVLAMTEDAAGNTASGSRTVTYDFDPPALVGTPYFERCDQYQPARLGSNDLYVKGDDYGCTAAGEGTELPILVSFALSEAATSTLRVHLEGGSDLVLDPAFAETDGSVVLAYAGDLTAEVDGARRVLAEVADSAGNASTLDLGTLRVDNSSPAVPAIDASGRIVYTRVPYGNETTAGQKQYALRGLGDSVEGLSTIVVQDVTGAEIGRTRARTDGSFGGALGTVDAFRVQTGNLPDVYLRQEDQAGLISDPAVRVRDVTWIATAGYKEAGSVASNPHVFQRRGHLAGHLRQDGLDDAWEVGADAGLDRVGGATLSQEGSPRVVDAVYRNNPSGGFASSGDLQGHAMAYDSARGRTVLFGGWSNLGSTGQTYGSTWEWDGLAWHELAVAGPSWRANGAMAYDPRRGKIVLFGGELIGVEEDVADTWEWDGASWQDVTPASGDSPPPYNGINHKSNEMVFDRSRGSVVLFAGRDSTTWAWDGQAWTRLDDGSNAPSARSNFALAYDVRRQRTVLFGGVTTWPISNSSETWEWDGSAWDLRTTAGPGGRTGAAMTYDEKRGCVVLVGGSKDNQRWNDTWEWDGTTWAQTSPSRTPAATYGAAFAFDSGRGVAFLVGGKDVLPNPYEWDGSTWRTHAPPANDVFVFLSPVMTYDAARANTLLALGPECRDNANPDSTYSWNGASWGTTGATALRGYNGFAAYDSARGRVVAVVGLSMPYKGYEWNGEAWADAAGASFHERPTGTYHRARGTMLGGPDMSGAILQKAGDVAWTYLGPWPDYGQGPPSGEMAYDARRKTAVLVTWKGTYELASTGTEWTTKRRQGDCLGRAGCEVCTPETCPNSEGTNDVYSIYYDSSVGAVVFVHGMYNDHVWLWNGDEWTPVGVDMVLRTSLGTAYDARRQGAVVLGGTYCGFGVEYGDTAEVSLGAWQPALTASMSLGAVGASEASWTNLAVKANAGGSGAHGQGFLYVNENLSWSDARDACQRLAPGAHLATIANAAEQAALEAALGVPVQAWIGFSMASGWVDGTPVAYTNWVLEGPGGGAGIALQATAVPGKDDSFKWRSQPATTRLPYVCELGVTEGTSLKIWNGAAWSHVASNTSAPATPGSLDWSSTGPIEPLLTGEERYATFALTPLLPNGWGGVDSTTGRVNVDYLEVTVQYRLPAQP